MQSKTILLVLGIVLAITFTFAPASGIASKNFCDQHPAYPECTSWRIKAVTDNYWFCEFVNLDKICSNTPDPQKEIPTRSIDYCCRHLTNGTIKTIQRSDEGYALHAEFAKSLDQSSRHKFIVWTDKDHYEFGNRVNVYGKLDFTDPEMASLNKSVDVSLNGKIILHDITIQENGWFSAYFYLSNRYDFGNQLNNISVNYRDEFGLVKTGFYKFTTGDLSQPGDNFKVWMDKKSLPHSITYGLETDSVKRFLDYDTRGVLIKRLVTPDGFSIPLNDPLSYDLSSTYDGFRDLGTGTYKIQITFGEYTSEESFKFDPNEKNRANDLEYSNLE